MEKQNHNFLNFILEKRTEYYSTIEDGEKLNYIEGPPVHKLFPHIPLDKLIQIGIELSSWANEMLTNPSFIHQFYIPNLNDNNSNNSYYQNKVYHLS